MSEAELKNLIRASGQIRTKVTEQCNSVAEELSDLTEHKRRTFLHKLESLKQEQLVVWSEENNNSITSQVRSDLRGFMKFSDERELYEDNIADALGSLSSDDTSNSTMNVSNNLFLNNSPTFKINKLKLPQVPLP